MEGNGRLDAPSTRAQVVRAKGPPLYTYIHDPTGAAAKLEPTSNWPGSSLRFDRSPYDAYLSPGVEVALTDPT